MPNKPNDVAELAAQKRAHEEELRKDATVEAWARNSERYEWLRDRPSLIGWDWWPIRSIPVETIISAEFMDEAIDEALTRCEPK